jgi:hypothetical protein
MPLTPDELLVLESYIDKYGIGDIVTALAHICGLKAEHCATNWGDPSLAKIWDEAATDLEGALDPATVI